MALASAPGDLQQRVGGEQRLEHTVLRKLANDLLSGGLAGIVSKTLVGECGGMCVHLRTTGGKERLCSAAWQVDV
jgi:hypothetical protein